MSTSYKGYLVDLDGTMYKGESPIKEAGGFIQRLREKEVPFLFVTNNSTSEPKDVAEKLNRLNVRAYEDEIYTSSLATTDYLKTLDGNSVYVVGEKGLTKALKEAGFDFDDTNPDFVVLGLDREVTFEKFEKATLAIQNGAQFIVTNSDTNLPTERGLIPGAGSLAALLETSTRKKPTFIGKPEAAIMDEAIKLLGFEKKDVLMVGDNYETDILAGIDNDIDTLLVLTGFTLREELEEISKQPDYIIENLDQWSI